jgi:hypothetical protein
MSVTEPPKSLGPPTVVLVQRTSDNPVDACWGPSAYEGPQKQDLTIFLEYNV